MQNTTNINSSQQSELESILFYGDFTSISPDIELKKEVLEINPNT